MLVQHVEGRRQKAEGRRQKAEGGRRKVCELAGELHELGAVRRKTGGKTEGKTDGKTQEETGRALWNRVALCYHFLALCWHCWHFAGICWQFASICLHFAGICLHFAGICLHFATSWARAVRARWGGLCSPPEGSMLAPEPACARETRSGAARCLTESSRTSNTTWCGAWSREKLSVSRAG